MASLATLNTWLTQAEEARQRLIIGELEVMVHVEGTVSTTFAQVNLDKLNAYISDLQSKIAVLSGTQSYRRQAIRMVR